MRARVLAANLACWCFLLVCASGCELIAGIDDRAAVASASASGPGGAGPGGAGTGAGGAAGSDAGGTGACPTGTADCDGSPVTACDSLTASKHHCGGCDRPYCAGGCLDGKCEPMPAEKFDIWVRADDGITLVDDQVAKWKNQAGPGGEIDQPLASSRPIMGTLANGIATRAAVELDGQDDALPLLDLIGFQQLVIVLVFAANSAAASTLFEFPPPNGPQIELWHPQIQENDLRYESGGLLVTSPWYLDTTTIVTLQHESGGLVTMTINGDPRLVWSESGGPSLPSATWKGAVLGNDLPDATRPFDGRIGEFIVARELSPAELGLVHAYLRAKYGIAD